MEPSFDILGLAIPKSVEINKYLYNATTVFGTVDQTLFMIDNCIIGEIMPSNNYYHRWIDNPNDYRWIHLSYSSNFRTIEKKSNFDSFLKTLNKFCDHLSDYYFVFEVDCDQNPIHLITSKEKTLKEILDYISSYQPVDDPPIKGLIYKYQ